MVEIVVRGGEGGRTVTAATNDRIRIELPENPTSGFRWQLAGHDEAALRLESDAMEPGADAALGGGGGGGLRVLSFAALRPGSAELRFELRRGWEAQPPRSIFTVQVAVA